MRGPRNICSSQSGETLTETLCALLAVALSSLLLATMLSAAARLNAAAIERDGAFYRGLTAAETGGGISEPGEVLVTGEELSPELSFSVTWHGSDGLWSYVLTPEEGETDDPT